MTDAPAEAPIVGRPGRPCIRKLRRNYEMPAPISLELVAKLAGDDGEVELQAFSDMVSDALDHIVVRWGTRCQLTGSIGGDRFIVTWRLRPDGSVPVDEVEAFESRLSNVAGRPVVEG